LFVTELPQKIIVENNHFDTKVIRNVDDYVDTLPDGSKVSVDTLLDENLFFSKNITGAILFIDGYCVSILKEQKYRKFYLFDSHSRDVEGKKVEGGKSILMQLSLLNDVTDYIFETYGYHCYQVVYIEAKITENGFDLGKSLTKFRRTKLYLDQLQGNENKELNDKVKENRKRHYSKHSDEIK